MAYFSQKLQSGFVVLFSSQAIRKAALSLVSIFLPIFLYEVLGKDMMLVVWFYLAIAVLYAVFLPLAARMLNYFKFKNALITGSLFGILMYAILVFTTPENAYLFIPIVLVVWTIFKLLYWVPYHTDFAKFIDPKDRGRGVSAMFATVSFAGVVGPILAGYILDKTSFGILFSVVVLLYLLSIVPLLRLPKVNETYTWGYAETWKKFFAKKYRRPLFAVGALGAENTIALIIWPIFIFLLLDGAVLDVGALSTIIFGAVVILQLALGRFIDVSKKQEYETLHIGSVLYALGWVGKVFVVTAFHIFIAGFYHGVTKIFTRTPFDTLVYEIAADQGHFVDEFTVLKEMALQFGAVISLVGVAVLLLFFSIEVTFFIGAGAALLLNLLYYQERDETFSGEQAKLPVHQLHY
ncbi:MAG: MFS transporter [Candidatus Paceibacterota bacterium]